MEQAAQWYALLRSGEASSIDRLSWQRWLDAAAEHRQAWAVVERVGQRFEPLQARQDRHIAAATFRRARGARPRRRQVLLALVGVAGAGWLGWRHGSWLHPVMAWTADQRADTGEIRHLALDDGSEVWLNAESAFNVMYSQQARRLHLLYGEMLVQTGKDARPFFVDTEQGSLRALGTRFTVRQETGDTLVAVYDGAVEVALARNRLTSIVAAGAQLRFTGEELGLPVAADPARAAWIRGLIVADGMRLADVVAELRRHQHGYINLADEVADLRVFGSYPADDPVRALTMLASVMPIQVHRTLPWWIRIDARS
ncbi:iron dicitrate transport regulator FecR [Bordetella genomosp. 4]|uniref:Iron dicitrate transport regulator FecR n=1 Tax=Bordetella genomosp. 4 TaxID=463044 RepID=A0A261U8B0_9BORD|nr:iron dicitrate transport regulator FecR [Bordetella genomosp. 4]OZI57747.1 iron dicitrate transport regulator FecR [Bordetella genomosp. 4]